MVIVLVTNQAVGLRSAARFGPGRPGSRPPAECFWRICRGSSSSLRRPWRFPRGPSSPPGIASDWLPNTPAASARGRASKSAANGRLGLGIDASRAGQGGRQENGGAGRHADEKRSHAHRLLDRVEHSWPAQRQAQFARRLTPRHSPRQFSRQSHYDERCRCRRACAFVSTDIARCRGPGPARSRKPARNWRQP